MSDESLSDKHLCQRYVLKDFLARFINSSDECQFFKITAELPATHKDGPWIAGGALRRTLLDDPLESDVDFFFHDPEQKQAFDEAIKERGGWLIGEKQNSNTYGVNIDHDTVIVQAVTIEYYASLEDVLDSFDFTITQFGYDGEDLVCGQFSLWDLSRKRLALHKLTYGVSTVRRLIKYTKQGFTACSGVLASILEEAIANPAVVHREVPYVD